MAIPTVHDYTPTGVSGGSGGGVSSLTFAHTVSSGANKLLLVSFGLNAAGVTGSSVTWDGTALTFIAGATQSLSGSNSRVEFWGLLNPGTKTGNVVVTLSGSSTRVAGMAVTVRGARQDALPSLTDNDWNPTTASSYTASINTAVADNLVALVCHMRMTNTLPGGASAQPQAGQTNITEWHPNATDFYVGLSSKGQASAGTATLGVDLTSGGTSGTARFFNPILLAIEPSGPPVLTDLVLSNDDINVSATTEATVGTLSGDQGGTLVMTNTAGGRFKLDGNVVRRDSAAATIGAYAVAVTETLAEASNSPHVTNLTINVVADTVLHIAASGNDSTGTGSLAAPFKSWVPALPLLVPGVRMRFRKGDAIKLAEGQFTGAIAAFGLLTSGEQGNPIVIEAYGTGTSPVISGDIDYASGWSAVASGDVEGNAFALANAQKRNMGVGLDFCKLAMQGGTMFYPTQWPLGLDRTAVENTDPTSGSFHNLNLTQFNAAVSVTGAGPYTITLDTSVLPASMQIATQYTGSLVGYQIMFRHAGSWTQPEIVATHTAGSNTITWQSDFQPFTPNSSGNFYWAIRSHPRDLNLLGQTAYLLNGSNQPQTIIGTFAGTLAKSVVRHPCVWQPKSNWITVNGVDFGSSGGMNTSTGDGAIHMTAGFSASNCSLSNVTLRNLFNSDRPAAFGFYSPTTAANWTLTNVNTKDILNLSGIRVMGSGVTGFSLDGSTVRQGGRTANYYAGSLGNAISRNVNASDQQSVHGNGDTSYQDSHDITFENQTVMNNSNPMTSQIDSVSPKSNIIRNCIYTGRGANGAALSAAFTTYVGRFDGGDTDTLLDRVLFYNGNNGMLCDGTPSSAGMLIKRSVLQSLVSANLTGVTFQDVLILNGGGGALANTAAMTAIGATVDNVLFDSSTQWNGCFSQQMQQFLTDNGVGGYEEILMGMDALDWTLPAWSGSPSFTLRPLVLTTPFLTYGFPAGTAFASYNRMAPGSSISLPAGEADNDDFALWRGQVYVVNPPTTANKTLRVFETNPNATNSPLTTDIVVPVEQFTGAAPPVSSGLGAKLRLRLRH